MRGDSKLCRCIPSCLLSMKVRRVKLASCSESSWNWALPFYGDNRAVLPLLRGLTATGVCNEEAISPKCWLLTSKKVIKIIVCITEPVGRFILELCKQSFSFGSSLCPRIILGLKNTLCFVTLLPLPWHCFWGVLRLPHLMLRAKFAGGDVRGLLVLFFFVDVFGFVFERVLIAIYCNSVPFLWVNEPHFLQRHPKVRDCEMATDKPDEFLGQASAESGEREGPTC